MNKKKTTKFKALINSISSFTLKEEEAKEKNLFLSVILNASVFHFKIKSIHSLWRRCSGGSSWRASRSVQRLHLPIFLPIHLYRFHLSILRQACPIHFSSHLKEQDRIISHNGFKNTQVTIATDNSLVFFLYWQNPPERKGKPSSCSLFSWAFMKWLGNNLSYNDLRQKMQILRYNHITGSDHQLLSTSAQTRPSKPKSEYYR